MKPFATLGSEISKVRERVRRGAEALRPTKVASDVRDQRDRLLAKLGEQTFRLIAERKLAVPKVLQDSVEKLATLLGVQLPPLEGSAEGSAAAVEGGARAQSDSEARIEGASEVASRPLEEHVEEPAVAAKPAVGEVVERRSSKKNTTTKKNGAKRRKKR